VDETSTPIAAVHKLQKVVGGMATSGNSNNNISTSGGNSTSARVAVAAVGDPHEVLTHPQVAAPARSQVPGGGSMHGKTSTTPVAVTTTLMRAAAGRHTGAGAGSGASASVSASVVATSQSQSSSSSHAHTHVPVPAQAHNPQGESSKDTSSYIKLPREMSDAEIALYCSTLKIPDWFSPPTSLEAYDNNFYNFLRHLPDILQNLSQESVCK
jgi:hypothetical protein